MFQRAKYFVLTLLVVALFAFTRNDLANMRALTTDNSFFTTQIAEVTRLEKELLEFRTDAAAYVHGYGKVTKDDVMMSFDLLWSRVNTQLTKFVNPAIDALRNYQHDLTSLSRTLADIDSAVASLKVGDHAALDRIENALQAHAPAMSQMNADAYEELIGRSVDMAVIQRGVTHSLDRFQWIFLIVGFAVLMTLLWQLRKGERLYQELKTREAEIRTLATVDALTGLNNRRHFDDRMKAIDTGSWAGNLQVLLVDLDGFKQINDQRGHAAGDHILQTVASRLPPIVGEHRALVARLGGDEFAVVFDGGKQEALDVAERIIEQVSRPTLFGGHSLRVGASVGISAWRPSPSPSALMLREADAALYEAKARGRGCACHYADMMSGNGDTSTEEMAAAVTPKAWSLDQSAA